MIRISALLILFIASFHAKSQWNLSIPERGELHLNKDSVVTGHFFEISKDTLGIITTDDRLLHFPKQRISYLITDQKIYKGKKTYWREHLPGHQIFHHTYPLAKGEFHYVNKTLLFNGISYGVNSRLNLHLLGSVYPFPVKENEQIDGFVNLVFNPQLFLFVKPETNLSLSFLQNIRLSNRNYNGNPGDRLYRNLGVLNISYNKHTWKRSFSPGLGVGFFFSDYSTGSIQPFRIFSEPTLNFPVSVQLNLNYSEQLYRKTRLLTEFYLIYPIKNNLQGNVALSVSMKSEIRDNLLLTYGVAFVYFTLENSYSAAPSLSMRYRIADKRNPKETIQL